MYGFPYWLIWMPNGPTSMYHFKCFIAVLSYPSSRHLRKCVYIYMFWGGNTLSMMIQLSPTTLAAQNHQDLVNDCQLLLIFTPASSSGPTRERQIFDSWPTSSLPMPRTSNQTIHEAYFPSPSSTTTTIKLPC